MPISQRVDKDARRIFARVWGEFSTSEIVGTITQVLTHPDFEPGFDVLSDHTGVTRIIERDQIQATALLLGQFQAALTGSRWAVVVGGSDLQWGMLRMLAGFASAVPIDMQTFRCEADAIRWLDESRDKDPIDTTLI